MTQGELEHRKPKARYRRTDRKAYIKQLTQIERRHARLQRIKQKEKTLRPPSEPPSSRTLSTSEVHEAAITPEQHHHIGKSENIYEDIGAFLRNNADDPAIKVGYPSVINQYSNLLGPGLSPEVKVTHSPSHRKLDAA